jgi:hypothetical protein
MKRFVIMSCASTASTASPMEVETVEAETSAGAWASANPDRAFSFAIVMTELEAVELATKLLWSVDLAGYEAAMVDDLKRKIMEGNNKMGKMEKYGVATTRPQLCPLCGEKLNTETNPPTCPKHGSAGIEKRSEDEEQETTERKDWGLPGPEKTY